MDLLHVCPGDLLVSSINFHQGAVAYNDTKDFVCSTHYQTFEIDTTRVIPEYLIMVLRSSKFINMVAGIKANGIKNESRYDFIGSFDIPLPSKDEQTKILDHYRKLIKEAEENKKAGDDYGDGLLLEIQALVSNLKKEDVKKTKSRSIIQSVSFSSATRWEVDYILKEGIIDKVKNSYKYKAMPVTELQKESLFGLSIKASPKKKNGMIPMLRMPNIVNGEVDCSDLKYLPKDVAITDKDPEKYLLKKGDFLINRTNSKELVGKSAVFNLDGDYTYASYVIRYRFDTAIVLPQYMNIMFMLPIIRLQIDTLSRQTAGQCNINSDEIGSISIPVPSLPEQKKIIKKYNDTKDGANSFYERALELREQAISDFENEIFV